MGKKTTVSDFNKNVLKLVTGTTIAQAIPILISPILTRVYTPEDFGVLALFIAITATIGSVSNGRYELAIILPEKNKDAFNITILALIISGIVSLTLAVLIILIDIFELRLFIKNIMGVENIGWLYLIPFVVFLLGSYKAFYYYNVREKYYKHIAQANILKATGLGSFQLLLGFLKFGSYGLIIAYLISNLIGNVKLITNALKNRSIKEISLSEMKIFAKRYIDFVKYSTFGTLTNQLSYYLLNIAIPILFGITTLGYYSLVERILGMPTSLIGKSIGDVYLQEAKKEKVSTGYTINVFKSTLKKLVLISVIPFSLLFFFVEDLVTIIFGENWIQAGVYAKIMIPLFFIRFIVNPLSMTHNIFEKQKVLLIWQISLLTIGICVILTVYLLKLPFITFLVILTISYVLMYMIHILIIFLETIGKI